VFLPCPFCTAELCAPQAAKDEFESVGATLAAVIPETRDFTRQLKRSLGLDLKVLSDVDYRVAVSYGVLFRVPDETKAHYSGLGVDLGATRGAGANLGFVAPSRFHVLDGRARHPAPRPADDWSL
jgi:hypothetical protein